jgi:hypothetical protein
VDLFEPGSGSQVHDFNGGILASGLFWILPVDRRALRVSRDGRHAVLRVRDVPVIDSFQFFGPSQTPASVSFRVEWDATGPFVQRGSGATVAPTDPAAFSGKLADATSTGAFAGSEFGFSFRSKRGVSTARGFAELGRERNGVFLS